jgi:hypothetical protein
MRSSSVRLLVAMFATQHTDFESFANALGALPNHPPVPMACEPSPSPIDVETKAIVQHVVKVLLKHSPSPTVTRGIEEHDVESGSSCKSHAAGARATRPFSQST